MTITSPTSQLKMCQSFFNHTISSITAAHQNHNPNVNVTLRALSREGRLKEATHILLTNAQNPNVVNPCTFLRTFLQLLETCIAQKALSEGRLIHSHISEMGFAFTLLQNKLIHMYVNCGSLKEAREVFDSMTERDVFSWNMIISAYQRHGYPRDALALFHQIQVQPNQFTFPSIIQACAKLGDLKQGLCIHQRVFKSGFLWDCVVGNALVDMYAKCGRVQDARELFDKMPQRRPASWNALLAGYAQNGLIQKAREVFDKIPQRDTVSWDAMIAGYAQNGFLDKALDIFKQMQLAGVRPSSGTFASTLTACAKMGALEEGMDIHQRIVEYGFNSDVVVASALIDMYAKCGSIEKARELFDKQPQRDTVSWNLMIGGYAQNGLGEQALEIFNQMQSAGVKPNSATFANVLPACAKMGALEKGMNIHQSIIGSGFSSDVVVASALIDMYAKCRRIHKAHELFDKLGEQDVVSWTALIAGYVQNGLVERAHELFDQMPRRNVVSWTAMIAGYAQNGLVEKARQLFDKMPQRGAVSWNAMIAGYAQNGLLEKALDIFKDMQLAGVKPTSATFASILPICAKMGALEQGMEIHERIIESGFSSEIVVANSLIDMYAKCGSIHKARELFDKMHNTNTISWNATIAGYAMHGYSKDALKLFELMKHFGANPDNISFACVLFACSHAGLVDEACKYFNSMSDAYCVMPMMDHYVCIVDLLGRAGCVEGALIFIVKMPIKPDVVVWMCLLGACRSHKNIGIGEFVARILFVLDPKCAASYVLLSNIYAEGEKWDDVQRVRTLMKGRGIKKTPGCSWIEVHKVVHAFV